MNKKFIATFAAAAMLCCVCNAGVAVADDNTDFNATITQLISQADNHIDALKKIVNEQGSDDLKKTLFAEGYNSLNKYMWERRQIEQNRGLIEKFEKDLAAAGDNPDQATLDALRAQEKQINNSTIAIDRKHNWMARSGDASDYNFRGYSDYSSWLKNSFPYEKLEVEKTKIKKLTAIDKQLDDLLNTIKLPSEAHPISIEDQSNYNLDQVKVKYWYDGEPNANNSAYVKAQLAFWHKFVEKTKSDLEDNVAKNARYLVNEVKRSLGFDIYTLNNKVEATVNVHNGDEYLRQELAQQGTLKKAFDHTIIHYGNGVKLPPYDDPNFDSKTYESISEQINTATSNIYNSEILKKFGFEFTNKNPSQLTPEQRKEYCDAYEKYTASRIENTKKLEELRKKQAELDDKNDHKAYNAAKELSTARDGAVSYAYLHLKFKKYVQDQLNNGKTLEQLLEGDTPAYNKAKRTVNEIGRKIEAGNYKKSSSAWELIHRYNFMVDLLASRDNDAYIKDALKQGKSYDSMLNEANAARGENNEIHNKMYQEYHYGREDVKSLGDKANKASEKLRKLRDSGASEEEIKQAEDEYNEAQNEVYKHEDEYLNNDIQKYYNKETELNRRIDLIKKLKSGEYDTTVLDIDNLALTPEQKSSEDVAPLDYNDSSFENPDGDTGNKPDNNPDGDSGNNPDGDTGNKPDNNPDDPFDGFNFDDIDWGDFNFDDLDLDDLGVDDVDAEDFDFSEFDTYASEISDDDLASLDIDDINFDDLDLGDLDLGDLDLGDFYNDDTQSGDTNSGETAKPGETKPGETKPGDTTNSGDTNAGNTAKPGETKPEDVAKPGETKPEDVAKPGDTIKPGDAKSSETIKPGDAKSAAAKIEAVKAEVAVDKTEDVKIEAAEADNDNAGDATQTDNVTKTQENNN